MPVSPERRDDRPTSGALAGLRVIDAATNLAAPLTAAMLGDYGADVIKVEHPQGDSLRATGALKDGHSMYWKVVNRNKRVISVDLGKPEGAEILRRLAASADVLIENFRPGTFERWGIGPDVLHELNPSLIMVRVSGFGQDGPYAKRPAFGTVVEAMSGWVHLNGESDGPPLLPPVALADHTAGMVGASLVGFALYARAVHHVERQVVDFALFEPLLTAQGPMPSIFDQLGQVPGRSGSRSRTSAPRNVYRCADGEWIAVASSATKISAAAMRVVGRPDIAQQPWFRLGKDRAAHADEIDEAVASWAARLDSGKAVELLTDAGVPASRVNDISRVVDDPQVKHRRSVISVPDADLGQLVMQNVIGRFRHRGGQVRWPGRAAGADTDAVLTELGFTEEEIARLRRDGIA